MTEWDRTQLSKLRLGLEDGFYQGRPIISRDSQVDGGVYLGGDQREAIVVDSQKYPKLKELYSIAKDRATINGTVMKDRILQAVYDTVAEAMPIRDSEAVEKLIHRCGVENDGKISLDVFLEKGIGICRHDALACAALLELFKKEGTIQGKASVDRNQNAERAHAWCRYTNSIGEVFILDVIQKYLGRLNDAPEGSWPYKRAEDL